MKAGILALVVLSAALALTQASPQDEGTPHQHEHRGQGAAPAHAGAMHQQHMQQMQQAQADLTKMRGLLEQMKANLTTMDSKDQAAMRANVQMWETLLAHMERMMSGMHGEMDRGAMHRERGSAPSPGTTPGGAESQSPRPEPPQFPK